MSLLFNQVRYFSRKPRSPCPRPPMCGLCYVCGARPPVVSLCHCLTVCVRFFAVSPNCVSPSRGRVVFGESAATRVGGSFFALACLRLSVRHRHVAVQGFAFSPSPQKANPCLFNRFLRLPAPVCACTVLCRSLFDPFPPIDRFTGSLF